ncbi:hypothetical protein F750_6430 [Streptomyces sp. PAMC 26508]|nr:hypothetical protein F750_6430 [Streptomyces sp. PAMC 26508]
MVERGEGLLGDAAELAQALERAGAKTATGFRDGAAAAGGRLVWPPT